LKTVCGDDVPTLQSLKSLKNERVDALNIAVGVYNLSNAQVAAEGEGSLEEVIVDISKLNADQHSTQEFQRSLKQHICSPDNKEFNNDDLIAEKEKFTKQIDELNNNMAATKTLTSYKQDSTVFTFLLRKNDLLIKKEPKTQEDGEKTPLEVNADKLAELKNGKEPALAYGCLGIKKNLENQERRISPLKKALEL